MRTFETASEIGGPKGLYSALRAGAATVKGNHKLFELEDEVSSMKIVLKIGGSLLFDDEDKFDISRIKEFAEIIQRIKGQKHQVVVIVGGGVLAKKLIKYGRRLDATNIAKDQLGISATWICAQLMITALQEQVYPTPLMTEEQIRTLSSEDTILVAGGLKPGQSTNAVAARIAEITKSKILLNVTDVDGVYDKDPKQHPNAQLLPEVTVSQLREIIKPLSSKPGTYPLFDKRALEIINRAQIEIWFVNGKDPQRILGALNNQEIGTRVIPD